MTPSSRFLSPERRCRTAGGSSERDNGELESSAEAVNAVPTAEAALASADTTAAPAVNAVPPPEAAPAGTAAPAAALTAAAPAAAVLAAAAISGRHNWWVTAIGAVAIDAGCAGTSAPAIGAAAMATAAAPAANMGVMQFGLIRMVLLLRLTAIRLAFVIQSCAPATRFRRGWHPAMVSSQQESELTASIHQAGFKTVSTRDARGVRRRRSARSWPPSGSSRGGRIRRVPC